MENNRTFENISEISDFREDKEEFAKYEIDPMFYCHTLIKQIIKAPQIAFMQGNIDGGIMSRNMGIKDLESLCDAEGFIHIDDPNDKYMISVKKIDEKYKGEEYKTMKETLREFNIANDKLKLLLKEVFSHRIKEVILYV